MFCNCCGKRKTKWILDDAIINGNHGGYPSDGIDEYCDVEFEGIKVKIKKNADNFMRTIYGNKYMEWLPPVKRISHHKWTIVDFGPYVEKYDLPKNYYDYLSIIYTPEKLIHMQKLSFDMVDYISNICKSEQINYYLLDNNCLYKEYDIEDYGSLWQKPLTIALPRKDYEKLCNKLEKNDNNYYFLQNEKTDKKYHMKYSRFMLNCTYLRDASIPPHMEEKMANGFYINIIPLDYAPDNIKKHASFRRKIKLLNKLITIKQYQAIFVKKRIINNRVIRRLFVKIRYLLLKPLTSNKISKKLKKYLNKYNNTNYYIDSTGSVLGGIIIDKNIIGSGKEEEYNGHKFVFPSKINEYNKILFSDKEISDVKYKQYLRKNSPKYYRERFIDNLSKEFVENIEYRYKSCHLNYFDLDDYQYSILRYDNIKKKYLTNEEVLKTFSFKN